MANEAKYEVLIPKHDELGNPLVEIAQHALKHAVRLHDEDRETRNNGNLIGHVERGREVYVNGRTRPHDVVVLHAQDHPRIDSVMKQLAAYVGDVANHQSVVVSKHGPNGIQAWPIANNLYVPGQPAEPEMLQNAEGPAVAGPPGIP